MSSNTLSDQLNRIAAGIDERAGQTLVERAQYGAEAQQQLQHIADAATRRPDGEALLARVSMLRTRIYIECLDMPDRSQPVPVEPHSHMVVPCNTCGRTLRTENEPIYPGPKPWTYDCAEHAPFKETT